MKQLELKTWQSIALGIVIGAVIIVAALLISHPVKMIPLTILPTLTPAPIAIHVDGEVNQTGLFFLPVTSRVQDAIIAAGGTTSNADLSSINLAAVVTDGQRIFIPIKGSLETRSSLSVTSQTEFAVHLNTATQKELEKLPGIGEEKAKAILAEKDRIGKFTTVDDLANVRGISDSIIDQIRPYLIID